MSQWYYAGRDRQRKGPVTAGILAGLVRNGELNAATTLVWREGLPQWQPLPTMAEELGLASAAVAPPPIPAIVPAPPPQAAAATRDPMTPRRPSPSAPPRRGLSGCMIALIVAVALALPTIAILAAIAIPAYHDYVLRAKVASLLGSAGPLQLRATEAMQARGRCPQTGDGLPQSIEAGNGVGAAVAAAEFAGRQCGLELRLHGTRSQQLDGKAIRLLHDGGQWRCNSDIDPRYLPSQCRG